MGFFNRKPKQTAKPAIPKGIRGDRLEEARPNAWTGQQATDSQMNLIGDSEAGGWRDQIKTPMARIRSEAVQARKLAEQIDSLSRNQPAQTRKQAVMTDSTTVKPGNVGEKQRRATDKPRAAKVRSTFNPLHPSMELPPEQLIRLLGLESKKIRKQRRAKTGPEQQTSTTTGNGKSTLPPELQRQEATKTTKETAPTRSESQRTPPESQPVRSTRRQREYERATERNESRGGRSLWLPALAVGLICGIAGSAYLFWMQPDQGTKATVPITSKVNRKPVSSAPGKPATKAPATADKAKQTPTANNDPAWLATIDARKKHLGDEAKQRFEQRLMQAAQKPSIVTAPIAPPQPDAVPTVMPVVPTSKENTPETTADPETSIAPAMPAAQQEPDTGDGALERNTVNPTTDEVTEPLTPTLQTSENQGLDNSSDVEPGEKQVPAATLETTDQPSDENVPIAPVSDQADPENTTELF